MQQIGIIGLGHMGGPMAHNLLKHIPTVLGFDLSSHSMAAFKAAGGIEVKSVGELAQESEVIITMLPAGPHVESVCLGDEGIFAQAVAGSLIIDCSSIDVHTSRKLAQAAKHQQLEMIDAPVSGGMSGAKSGTLTFMVGGSEEAFERAKPILAWMGKNILYAGQNGNGQAAKICNNMLLGTSMIAVSEAFNLAKNLGLTPQAFFDICSVSSGNCWSLTQYAPEPGLVPTSPANRDYEPGFTGAMMLKDLKLSQMAAEQNATATPMGALATSLYQILYQQGLGEKDFSAIIKFLAGK